MLYTPNEVAVELARRAEAVCRRYLSNGQRQGRYWIVGDVRNAPGSSMFVRLVGPVRGRGAAGRWTDAATGERGDLIDVIRASLGLAEFRHAMDEARRYLLMTPASPQPLITLNRSPAPTGSPEAARRLLAISNPIGGTLAETYLRGRGIIDLRHSSALRFHPRCYHMPAQGPTETWPAMIAAVTDLSGNVTGVHRTWLARDGSGKAPLDTPRRAMGELLGHAVRFGTVSDALVAGEGIETVLSLRQVMPELPMAACLSAAHLGALAFPPTLRRLYVACDDDAAGEAAWIALAQRARAIGIQPIMLSSRLQDFNDDLVLLGIDALRTSMREQLAIEDVLRFLGSPA
ncbi:toprim domain-containing protein [Devosia sp. ZB163]|uniref:DUF7146 domain-containing protein n=1 Tax=Devosia sp. ZB163 TaxID=3025938 RepID=UPI00235E6A92|nr:toprim domain-containing protein [Devosia sp. ZB163]MDC9823283.1 toprim domain-containing protein [Devosia sp. ZB163]